MIRALLGSIMTGGLSASLMDMPILAAVVFAVGITGSLIWGLS